MGFLASTQPRVTFGVVGFRLNKRIEPFSTQYCCAQPNLPDQRSHYGNSDRIAVAIAMNLS
ncbi:MAG: hypothetical protein EWV85_21575 [Microcystis aeruginosa Ma_QC_C_20070703_M131]|uniref:Uncharacterized protein n=1 Tax=Microcystis aeruginosa Ma_QC_C_20070703_M131 TaxID=2486263 RepID=A0A551X4V8_MICAE|nr:MAG: hypothetical protein EWV85_21575 [Microcystis aeruginosa Ma_QC_C_20070703_M131]